uniref:glucan endo-1,3-beta-D-glucosidase n=1 Tax=Anthurium amnicola TaxID=1678845 RepID=A0A1D1XJK8_9ARAE
MGRGNPTHPRCPLLLLLLLLPCSPSPRPSASAAPPPPPAGGAVDDGGTGPYVGVNIGTDVSNPLPPADVVAFLRLQRIAHVRLFEPDAGLLAALAGTGIRVCLGVPNNQLLALGASNATAAAWVARYVLAFHPGTLVSLLSVGDEVLTSAPNAAPMLLPAILNLHAALAAAGLEGEVKVSTPHSFAVVLDPFPPSQAYFNQTLVGTYLLPVLRFLSDTGAPLMLNLYPYYVLMLSRGVVPLDNALFRPLPPAKEEVDPNTLLHYTNVLDAMVDAAYFSMRNLNVTGVPVLVTETGWPHGGDPRREPHATRDNADAYNSNLIRHVLLERAGTPLRPEATPSVYIYELFDEDLRGGPASEAQWGLFYGNTTPVYLLHVAGSEGFLANDTANRTYCVAAPAGEVDGRALQAALDWACGPGRADCSGIQPGEACYEPNTVRSHASYAFDSYYQRLDRAPGSCYFQGAAMVTTTDPSHGSCIFPGRQAASGTGNEASTNGTVTSDGGHGAGRRLPRITQLLGPLAWCLVATGGLFVARG